jgi:hypothetical protein
MLNKLVLLSLVILLPACMTHNFVPKEYVLKDGRISQFPVAGTVQVNNLQPNDEKTILFSAGSTWEGDYKSITEHLRWQLDKEIQKNGVKKSSASQKTIGVKVTSLSGIKGKVNFSAAMNFTVTLGNGEILEKHVTVGGPGNVWRKFNGAFVWGVIEILKDEKVKKYLSE